MGCGRRAPPERQRQLARFLAIDGAVTIGSTGFLLAIQFTVSDSPVPGIIAIFTASAGLLMLAGLVPLRRGRIAVALRMLAGANWGIALVASGLAPMADRLGAFGGRLDVVSAVGAGTAVSGTVPLKV